MFVFMLEDSSHNFKTQKYAFYAFKFFFAFSKDNELYFLSKQPKIVLSLEQYLTFLLGEVCVWRRLQKRGFFDQYRRFPSSVLLL